MKDKILNILPRSLLQRKYPDMRGIVVGPPGVEPGSPAYKAGALTPVLRSQVLGLVGFEPTTHRLKADPDDIKVASSRTRTYDGSVKSRELYQLSYGGVFLFLLFFEWYSLL